MTNPVGVIKTLWGMATNFRSIMRERDEKKRTKQDDERLPGIIQMMDETEQKVRKDQNLHAYVPVFDEEEWWVKALPGVPHRLIRRGMEQREKKKARLDSLWASRRY